MIGTATVHHAHEHERTHLQPGEPFDIVVELCPQEPIEHPVLTIEITDRRGNLLYGADTDGLGTPLLANGRATAGPAAHRPHVAARRRLPGVAQAHRPRHRAASSTGAKASPRSRSPRPSAPRA